MVGWMVLAMPRKQLVQARIDKTVREEAAAVLTVVGLAVSGAPRLFHRSAVTRCPETERHIHTLPLLPAVIDASVIGHHVNSEC